MPQPRTPRTLLAIPASLALLGMAQTGLLEPVLASSQSPVTPSSDTALARLVTRGGAPAAALLADEGSDSRLASAGDGIARADHFRAGSITKTFVATVVLQLAAEHRLSLSDSVDDHLPGLVRGAGNDGRRITLRALPRHTSGLHDFTSDTGGTVPLTPLQARTSRHHPSLHRPRQLRLLEHRLRRARHGRRAGHRPLVRRRGRTPYHHSPPSARHPPSRVPASPFPYRTDARTPRTAPTSPSSTRAWPGAAGELVSTLADLDRFYAALLGGGLLPSHWLREMLDTRAAHGAYGMGLFPVKLPCGTTVWGHNGRISGSYVRSAATLDGRRVLTFRVNTGGVTDPALEPAVLAAEFCPRTP
ncbi:serine hydrolase domain-containing protein [Streptomyces sp. NPDC005244]|uniref:serine hydrolase domain-containing protein n=1 Tax=Streptomyces sp. NPDC005244 TaxID=3364708 RepID=UPI0036A4D599